MDAKPEFLTVEALAELLQTTPNALYVQRHRGEAPGALSVKAGKRLLWRRQDIEHWFDAQLAAGRR